MEKQFWVIFLIQIIVILHIFSGDIYPVLMVILMLCYISFLNAHVSLDNFYGLELHHASQIYSVCTWQITEAHFSDTCYS